MRSHSQTLDAIKNFIDRWKGRGYEKGESQQFWTELLQEVLEVERPGDIISFENQVKLASTSFIDAYIAPTKVLIEQKSIDKDLRKAIKQSDGSLLNPFQQAKRYAAELPVSKHPRWVVTCNFKSFLIYDMENPHGEPEEVLLANLEKDYYRLRFLVEDGKAHLQRELEISIKAGELVGKLYDAFLRQYGPIPQQGAKKAFPHGIGHSLEVAISPEDLHSLNVLCVRLVFCLYAEDAGIFSKDQFYYYMAQYKPSQMNVALRELFTTLDTKIEDRGRFLSPSLKAFPYVNGSLFHQNPCEDIPQFDEAMAELLLHKASLGFDWSEISPTIFGAVFESTLNPETRRSGGMHYTSIENIHKVIDPLFLNDLRAEFEQIKEEKQNNKRKLKLEAFQDKLASLTFLDPACGSGNFLTETYISLRRLENEAISLRLKGQKLLGFEQINPIKVNIHQFYGIEINDFAVTVAKTALWIAESQMMHETERIIKFDLDYLPLKSFTNIHCGNALLSGKWEVGSRKQINYIMGNPPFIGARWMNKAQKINLMNLFPKNKRAGELDYVCGWYVIAANTIANTDTKCGFVSTNSITQGEQVSALWKELFNKGVYINFAYRTFKWESESTKAAAVYCVIIGFGAKDSQNKYIYDGVALKQVTHINPYLIEAPDIMIESRSKPLSPVLAIQKGCQPTDGGNLILEDEDYFEFINKEPKAIPYIKRLIGSREFINNKKRWCLWLVGISPSELRKMPLVIERVEKCRQMRLNSSDSATRKLAERPTQFRETINPKSCIVIPEVSSENRRYIPMGFIDDSIICTNKLQIIPDATLYHFGVLTSNVHMAWMRAVCGRLEMRYDYSQKIVYNNFPWPDLSGEWEVGSGEYFDKERTNGKKLQRADRLAEGNGSRKECVCPGKETAKVGNLCAQRSNATSGSVNSVEYSRRSGKSVQPGVQSVPVNSEGVSIGIGNTTSALCDDSVFESGRNTANNESSGRNRTYDSFNKTTVMKTSHFPLPTMRVSRARPKPFSTLAPSIPTARLPTSTTK